MCMEPLGYGSISSTYFFGASGRASARNRPSFSQRSCQVGSTDFGSYRSLSFMVGARLEPGRTSYPPPGGDATFHHFDREPGPMGPRVVASREISAHEDQEVELRGWLYNKRSSGKLHFLQIRDGTGVIQAVVFKNDVPAEQFTRADHLGQESALIVRGLVKKDARSPIGYELSVKHLEVVSEAKDYPITPKEHGVAYLMEHRHLWLRSARQNVILRVRATVVKAIRDYFDGNGVTLGDAPIFPPAACEGSSTLFTVPYFDLGNAYLTQSGQLYMEAAAAALGKVYCFGPTFRAEKSKTRRHLAEFWMVEPEVAFMKLDEDMRLADDLLSYIVERVLETRQNELK